jgi:DNA-binding CsgD family transcriptional regulator
MSFLQRFNRWRKGLQKKKKYHSVLGNSFNFETTNFLTQENQTDFNLHSQTVSLPHNLQHDKLYQSWLMLTPREQDVTALTCLKYTDKQIAARLGLSKATVRTYIEKVYIKLDVQSKSDLRVNFANWDFSEWERRKQHR